MKGSNYLIWFRRLVVLGAVVAGLTASAAGAVPMLDPQATPANPVVANTTPLGLRADGLRWQAIAKQYQQGRQTPVGLPTAAGIRADGLRWQGIAKAYQQNTQAPPDVVERYVATHPDGQGTVTAATSGASGLNWGDFGIGAGAMFGLALLVAGLSIGAVAMRHRGGRLSPS